MKLFRRSKEGIPVKYPVLADYCSYKNDPILGGIKTICIFCLTVLNTGLHAVQSRSHQGCITF